MLNLALGTYFVVDELVVPVEVLLLLLVNLYVCIFFKNENLILTQIK